MLYMDKAVLVTGGASGIGRAAAIAFAREGARVAVADCHRAGGNETVQLILGAGGQAIFIDTDVASETSIIAMVKKTVAEFGRLDAAFNNAAMSDATTAVECSNDEWENIIRVNMTSVWLCMKYEIPEMVGRGGAIVNTSSRAGDSAIPSSFGYIATKHAVVGMSRSAAIDFAAQNIRVNALLPGLTDTPMFRASIQDAGGVPSDGVAQAMRVPLQRLGRAQEVAELVVWLCSDRASYMTGNAISVDGGMCARL